ncbi:MAG: hypothetical protein LUH55_06275 [Bacteroides thetaiotaomicron]|nr:hypothetical protein [Bacteroides thetaiotaomicron]
MTITIKKPKDQDILFWVAYGLYLIFGMLSTSFYYKYFMGTPYSIIKYLCVGLLVIRELMTQKYSIRSLAIGAVFIALAIITRSQSSVSTVVFILIFLFCVRNIDFKDVARFSAFISAIILIFVICSSYLGIIDNYVFTSETRVRHYLGFRYSLFGPCFLFNITGLVLYAGGKKLKWRWFILLGLVNFWMFAQTNSRLSFYLSLLMIAAFAFLKLRPDFFERKRGFCWVMIISFVLCFCISLYFTVTYNSSVEWQNQLDTILGSKLRLGQTSLLQSGVSFFGQRLELVGNGLDAFGNKNTNPYNYVDSFYIQILQRYGIIFSMVWIGLLTYTMYRCYRIKDYPMMVCLTFIALHCVVDDLSLSLYYNTFWFAGTLAIKRGGYGSQN